MKQAAIVGCLALATIAHPLVRYRVTVDGGSVSALSYSFLKSSATFVPPALSGASGTGSAPSSLSLSVPSVGGPPDTFSYALLYDDGASYQATGLRASWLSTYGTYEFPGGPLGEAAYFTTEEAYVTAVPEPASLAALALGAGALIRRRRRT
ncbi:PEP-CTERM sorting domain-containing protein [bacterium]|nr:MAG: PEP-CTERM sorting domain-containing protein [bacterium]